MSRCIPGQPVELALPISEVLLGLLVPIQGSPGGCRALAVPRLVLLVSSPWGALRGHSGLRAASQGRQCQEQHQDEGVAPRGLVASPGAGGGVSVHGVGLLIGRWLVLLNFLHRRKLDDARGALGVYTILLIPQFEDLGQLLGLALEAVHGCRDAPLAITGWIGGLGFQPTAQW